MAMFLTSVPVFLKQGLGIDWLALTASFVVMVMQKYNDVRKKNRSICLFDDEFHPELPARSIFFSLQVFPINKKTPSIDDDAPHAEI